MKTSICMAIKWTIRIIASVIVIDSAVSSCVIKTSWKRRSALMDKALNGEFKPGDILDKNAARWEFTESEYECNEEVYGLRMYGASSSSVSFYYTRRKKEYERMILHSICVVWKGRMDPEEYWIFYDMSKMCKHIQLSHEAVRRKKESSKEN